MQRSDRPSHIAARRSGRSSAGTCAPDAARDVYRLRRPSIITRLAAASSSTAFTTTRFPLLHRNSLNRKQRTARADENHRPSLSLLAATLMLQSRHSKIAGINAAAHVVYRSCCVVVTAPFFVEYLSNQLRRYNCVRRKFEGVLDVP
jgi:hypothetical protein